MFLILSPWCFILFFRNITLPLIVDETIDETEDGFYNITATGTYVKEELNNPTIFDCDISIPGTDYVIKRSITYYPG